ncbi:mannose-6-phosphate isomerase-like [Hibiscus syriacus]|uniref:mannose-6-phosphate isomerase-like n=1 Tax=Hibiscus syriacus TaxID=106335 RepID=UPI001923694B|nr:mannose-6-phosphate isomerase-like [Hibiscus syriacus]
MAKANIEKVVWLLALNFGSEIEPDRPYAEFWMGTHDSEPSFMADDNGEGGNLGLRDWILKNPNMLGHKVLSLAKPLSRQEHSNKELAKELHKLKRNLYKNANHKPEMALAITEFKAFCGFITFEVIHESCSVFCGGTSLSCYDYGNDMHDETLSPNHIQNRDIRYLYILPTTFGNPLWFTDDEMLELRETILYRATELRAVATWDVPVPKGSGTTGASDVPTSSVEANAHS